MYDRLSYVPTDMTILVIKCLSVVAIREKISLCKFHVIRAFMSCTHLTCEWSQAMTFHLNFTGNVSVLHMNGYFHLIFTLRYFACVYM